MSCIERNISYSERLLRSLSEWKPLAKSFEKEESGLKLDRSGASNIYHIISPPKINIFEEKDNNQEYPIRLNRNNKSKGVFYIIREVITRATIVGVRASGFSAYKGTSILLHSASGGTLPFKAYETASVVLKGATGKIGFFILSAEVLRNIYTD